MIFQLTLLLFQAAQMAEQTARIMWLEEAQKRKDEELSELLQVRLDQT